MSFFKVKRDLADKLFSDYIRKRDGSCVLCGSEKNLTCSHYYGRRHESVGFDAENCDTFGIKCHMEYENEKGYTWGIWEGKRIRLPKKYTQWKQNQLGEQAYNLLVIRAAKFKKKDRKMEVMRIKELLKTL